MVFWIMLLAAAGGIWFICYGMHRRHESKAWYLLSALGVLLLIFAVILANPW